MTDIGEIRKRARASWWEDGLTEMISGLGILLIGLYGFLMNASTGSIYSLAEKGLFVLILLSIFLVRYLIRRAKEKWVWPFTGYSIPSRSRGIWTMGGVVLALIMIVLILLAHDKPVIYEASLSIFVSIILSSIAIYSGLKRFWIYAAISLITGLISIYMGADSEIFPFVLLTITGAAMTASGIILFSRFKKEVADGHLQEDN